MKDYHLVILVHGLWGNLSNLLYIQQQIEDQVDQSKQQIAVYKTGSHSGFLTYDGVDVNGKRVADEIQCETDRLNLLGLGKVSSVSVVGYSLGGLIARYAIGALYFEGYFDQIEPINFVTFCSPHVGVLTPGTSLAVKLFNFFVPHVLARTGQHFFLADHEYSPKQNGEEGLPLLVWMADPRSYFYKALGKFKNRALYANIINDKRTSWFTSAISSIDPFESALNSNSSIYNLAYIPKYEPTVIDFGKPMEITRVTDVASDDVAESLMLRIKNQLHRKWNWLKFITVLLVYTPLWGCYLLSQSLVERVKLSRRVLLFFRETSNDLVHLYQMVDEEKGEKKVEELESDSDYAKSSSLEDPGSGLRSRISDQTDGLLESVFDVINNEEYREYHYNVKSSVSQEDEKDHEVTVVSILDDRVGSPEEFKDFYLDISPGQQKIVRNLNQLSWQKFPVLIRNTKSTHAAAIVKFSDPTFEEGKTIVDHFVRETFQV